MDVKLSVTYQLNLTAEEFRAVSKALRAYVQNQGISPEPDCAVIDAIQKRMQVDRAKQFQHLQRIFDQHAENAQREPQDGDQHR